jgi:hypothetical protein
MSDHPRLTLDRITWRNELAMALTEAATAVRAAQTEADLQMTADIVLGIANEIRVSAARLKASDTTEVLKRASERLAKIRVNHK